MTAALGEFVKQLRERQGVSLREMQRKTGISASGLSLRERGKLKIKPNDREAIARALGLSLSQFDAMWHPRLHEAASMPAGMPSQVWPISTGADGVVSIVVVGDSMDPSLRSGDVVTCRPINPYEQATPIRDGEAVVVKFAPEPPYGDEYQFCRAYTLPDGRIHLKKDNPRYPSMTVPREDIDAMWTIKQRTTPYV